MKIGSLSSNRPSYFFFPILESIKRVTSELVYFSKKSGISYIQCFVSGTALLRFGAFLQ